MISKWSPLNRCCIFYTAKTGTKILLHLELVQYIVASAVLLILDFVASELKNFFADHKNIYYEAYQQYRIQTFIIFICTFVITLLTVIAGIISLQKNKPILLIPYLIYSVFKAGVICLLAVKFCLRRSDIIAQFNDVGGGLNKVLTAFGFGSGDLVTQDLIRYGVNAITALFIAVAISNIHFIQVLLECLYDIRGNRRKQRTSIEWESNRVDV